MDIWPGLAWHVYHLSTEDLELTESGVNAESRDDDRLGQLPAPHPAIPSHVRVRGGPEEKPAAGEDSFVRSPNRRQIEGSHSPHLLLQVIQQLRSSPRYRPTSRPPTHQVTITIFGGRGGGQ